jgi:beta-carotene 15,15'-dioxygenase
VASVFILGGGPWFFHGALDTILLVRTTAPLRWATQYLLVVLALLAVLSFFPDVALLLLIGMFVWHFGEAAAHSFGGNDFQNVTLRLALGGASVMLPALISGADLQILVQALLPTRAALVWLVWFGCAWLWAGLAVAALLTSWRSKNNVPTGLKAVVLEIACLAALNALLSPLMAFALYFGLFHSLMHIRNVWRVCGGRISAVVVVATGLVLVLTTLILLGLVWLFKGAALHELALQRPSDALLRSIVVALAALTVPHGWVVGYFSKQLVAQ